MGAAQILAPVLDALAADNYPSTVVEEPGVVYIDVQAGPGACDECLVPKPMLESMLASTLTKAGVAAEIRLSYPAAHHDEADDAGPAGA